jgi:isoquinoline 1-oxidoreductase alpha subunit
MYRAMGAFRPSHSELRARHRDSPQNASMNLSINGQTRDVPDAAVDPQMPLLWVLRDVLHLTGTKFGCGVAACGACTVHVDGQAVRSCVTPLAAVAGKPVRTIEALGSREQPHPLQSAWIAHQVPQCGYCQSGMLMAAAALLAKNPNPSDADIDAAITNLCRCGTYPRVRAAIKTAAAQVGARAPAPPRAGGGL